MKLLSIILSFVMLLSVCAAAEAPDAASAVITVRDAIVTIGGEEIPLNPSIVLGVSGEDNSALIDVGMPLGDDVLFPVQIRYDESGLGLLLGESETLYTLTPAFFEEMLGGVEIPDETFSMAQSYGELLNAASGMDPSAALEQQRISGEKLMELIGDAPAEEASFHANGEDQVGQRVVFALTNEQVLELMDSVYAQMPEGFSEAYFGYLNALSSMTGMPEVNSFGDLFALYGMEMTVDGEIIYNETSAVADFVLHATAASDPAAVQDSGDEAAVDPISIDMPMKVTVNTPENVEYSVSMNFEGVEMLMDCALIDGAQTVSATIAAEGETVMTMDVNVLPIDESAVQTLVSLNLGADGVALSAAIDSIATGKDSTTACEFAYDDGAVACGASFAIDIAAETFADRTTGKTGVAISSVEELQSNSGLLMAGMSLLGGAEKLMSDESIVRLVEAVQPYLYVADTVSVEETVETAENVSVPTPEFGWLPEGFELTESIVQPDAAYASFYIEKPFGDDSSAIYIDMSVDTYTDFENTATYVVVDGVAQPADGPVITILHSETGADAYTTIGNIDVWLSFYNSELTDEEIIQLLTGISFPEAAA